MLVLIDCEGMLYDAVGVFRFLRETLTVGSAFAAPGAAEEGSRLRLSGWEESLGIVYAPCAG